MTQPLGNWSLYLLSELLYSLDLLHGLPVTIFLRSAVIILFISQVPSHYSLLQSYLAWDLSLII